VRAGLLGNRLACPYPCINFPYVDCRRNTRARLVSNKTGLGRKTSSHRHGAGPPVLPLRRTPSGRHTGSVPRLHAPPAVRLLSSRARSVRVAAAEAGGEAAGRQPLRCLRLDQAAICAPRGGGLEPARGSRDTLLALSQARTRSEKPCKQGRFFREESPHAHTPGRRQFRPEARIEAG
jgi:hypothetical protein